LQGFSNPQMYTFVWSSGFNVSWQTVWEALKNRMSTGTPVIVLLDCPKLGWANAPWSGHYVVVYQYDGSSVYVGNSLASDNSPVIAQDLFLSAWDYLPGFSHVMVDFFRPA
jgi:hypothetical protein